MQPSRFADREGRLASEGREKYRGTARIALEVLHFPWAQPREPSQKSVDTLKRCFEEGQCDRVTRNHVPAVIDQSDLDEVLRCSNVSVKRLLNNENDPHPTLTFPVGYQLRCLHGRQRIQAAREVLPPRERWWTVDLYLADLDKELKTALVEEYSNEEPPSDGEIYCKIRRYERERDLYSENRWRARLSKHGAKCFEQLSRHRALKAAFDDLLDIHGLWKGMRLSTLDKMIGMRCDEEVLCYLAHIKQVWFKILHHNQEAMQMVEEAAVGALELRAPRNSKNDAHILHGQLASGQIFALFNVQDREMIWNELRTIDGLIPSLATFFEDLKYLQACAGSLKHLLEPTPRHTVRSALDDLFTVHDQCVIQQAESSFEIQPTSADTWYWAYRQLWLGSMRYYPKIPAPPKKNKKILLAKAGTVKTDTALLSKLATLAHRVGFRSDKISSLMESSDRDLALDVLLKAREPGHYEYSDHVLQSHVEQIVSLFASATPSKADRPLPTLVCDDPRGVGNRCGFPDEEAHARDRESLFINNLHVDDESQAAGITSFYVRRSVYFAFFGRPTEMNTIGVSHSPPPEVAAPEPVRSPPSLGLQSNVAPQGSTSRQALEAEDQAVPERAIAQEHERAVNVRERQESVDSFLPLDRDDRRGTQIDLERIIADGLASIPEGSSPEVQAAESLDELVDSYRDLVRTDDTDLPAAQQLGELQIKPEVRIEFKIQERGVWRTDRSLLVNPWEPSEVERITKKYMRKRFRPFDTSFNPLVPRTCFQAVTADGTNTVILISEDDIRVNNQLVAFEPSSDVGPSTAGAKRGRHQRAIDSEVQPPS